MMSGSILIPENATVVKLIHFGGMTEGYDYYGGIVDTRNKSVKNGFVLFRIDDSRGITMEYSDMWKEAVRLGMRIVPFIKSSDKGDSEGGYIRVNSSTLPDEFIKGSALYDYENCIVHVYSDLMTTAEVTESERYEEEDEHIIMDENYASQDGDESPSDSAKYNELDEKIYTTDFD